MLITPCAYRAGVASDGRNLDMQPGQMYCRTARVKIAAGYVVLSLNGCFIYVLTMNSGVLLRAWILLARPSGCRSGSSFGLDKAANIVGRAESWQGRPGQASVMMWCILEGIVLSRRHLTRFASHNYTPIKQLSSSHTLARTISRLGRQGRHIRCHEGVAGAQTAQSQLITLLCPCLKFVLCNCGM